MTFCRDGKVRVPVGREDQRADDVGVLQGVEMLPVVEVPEHGLAVLAAAGAQGAVGGEGDGVEVSGVADVVGLQLAVGQVPHLDVLVPPARHDDGVGGVGGEAHAAHPVAVALVLDGVLALGERVPQLDALVAARGHDLPVVHGEGHGQHVLGVVLEPAGRLAGAQIPQTQVLVPGSRQSKVACK